MNNTIIVSGPMSRYKADEIANSLGRSNHSIVSLSKDWVDEDGKVYAEFDDSEWYVEKDLDAKPSLDRICNRSWDEINGLQMKQPRKK